MFAITLDTKALANDLIALGERQIPFAVSKALNDLAIRAADEERAVARQNFVIRQENVLRYGIARTKQATKTSLFAEVGVPPKFDFLNKFEMGGLKTPRDRSTVAVPQLAVKGNRRGIVPTGLRIKALALVRKGAAIEGQKKTFLIRPKSGSAAALILQRVGRGKSSRVRVLYVLERSVPVEAILHFVETETRVAEQQWPDAWRQAFEYTMRTAR